MARRRNKYRSFKRFLMVLILAMICATASLIKLCLELPGKGADGSSVFLGSSEETLEETEAPPAEPEIIRATVAAQGDLLMHKPVMNACVTGESYDFSSIFRYLSDYTQGFDYMVANLETTLGGSDFPYQGNPSFNCRDELLDAVKAAGCDMLLTANNHSYDTLMTGINRTLTQVRGKGLEALGTRLNEDEKRYSVIDVNGIRLGMVCYTFTLSMDAATGLPRLNNNSPMEKPEQINYFSTQNLNRFYSQMEELLTQMKADGAEATILYIHWGTEYELTENATQRDIAQKMCDMGIDVIVGGHPHVVQPMSLLTSNVDAGHKTVCVYSLGNAVSNQRREEMDMKTGHTEDGAIFTVTFEKAPDGEVRVADADILPTWVNMTSESGRKEYNILPLDDSTRENWQESYGLTDAQYAEAKNAYDRTMAIVGPGLTVIREYLAGQ